MAGKVVNQRSVLLAKFGHGGQESSPKTATSHMRETLTAIFEKRNAYEKLLPKNFIDYYNYLLL